MANIATKSLFVGDINLPKSDNDNINLFITRFEKEILTYLLGYTLYSALEETPDAAPYKNLINGVEYEIEYNGNTRKVKWGGLANVSAYYVYCEKMRRSVTSTQSVGEVKSKQENSFNAGVMQKVMSAWTHLMGIYGSNYQNRLIPSAYNFLYQHKDSYPEWEFTHLIGGINSHDL